MSSTTNINFRLYRRDSNHEVVASGDSNRIIIHTNVTAGPTGTGTITLDYEDAEALQQLANQINDALQAAEERSIPGSPNQEPDNQPSAGGSSPPQPDAANTNRGNEDAEPETSDGDESDDFRQGGGARASSQRSTHNNRSHGNYRRSQRNNDGNSSTDSSLADQYESQSFW